VVAFRHSGDFSAAMSADHSVSPKPSKSPNVRSPSKPSAVTGLNQNASNNTNSYMKRETGVIEKLLVCAYLDGICAEKCTFTEFFYYHK